MAVGALDDLGQIVARRAAAVESRKAALRAVVQAEDKGVQQRLRELSGAWAASKPLHVRQCILPVSRCSASD